MIDVDLKENATARVENGLLRGVQRADDSGRMRQ